jgi:ABC-type oligopeptide transport system substrate-binding subunit
MRKTILMSATILATALALAGCSTTTDTGSSSSVSPSSSASASSTSSAAAPAESLSGSRTGTFSGLNGKTVAGSVTVTADSVVLSNFSSDEGPDLHVYLANGTDEAAVAAGKEISAVAFDKATQSFSWDGAEAGDYTNVVIHCDKAKAVFGAAALS